MLPFILNQETIHTDLPPGTTVLDYIRYHHHLTGTKIGCREGDCGACTVMVGELREDGMHYRTMTSCLMPLSNAAGKHIVTVEGINPADKSLTAVQQAMAEENGTQCGFCTPGFVMSLTCFCLNHHEPTSPEALSAIDGNICRCTGYKSIERAADRICSLLQMTPSGTSMTRAIDLGIVPEWFSVIPMRLDELQMPPEGNSGKTNTLIVGGGTDLYVQKPEEMIRRKAQPVFDMPARKEITLDHDIIEIGGSVTVTDLMESGILQSCFPNMYPHLKLVSSTPIRNMATVAGNLVNASPIGDLTIWFLALEAKVVLRNSAVREIPLRDFYQGYKILAKTADESVEKVYFKKPGKDTYFNFEKVSKRRYLDIATVNTAITLRIANHTIIEAHMSAGGVAPIPLYLKNTSSCLIHHTLPLDVKCLQEMHHILQAEIHPIDDVRGTAAYKRLLLQQLFHAHLLEIYAVYAKH
jgi:xanthine dehydrogenase small subunit